MPIGDTVLLAHPGTKLARELEALNLPRAEVARLICLSRQTLHELLTGKQALTTQVALKLARLTATRAETWLALQYARDLASAKSELGDALERIPVLQARW